ncbi:MAG: citrate/2-methylcitrate synthase [Sphingobacteriia bacterium]|nr:citrate/2-methylcitrate synthase [Sphingobacteriia bacterium]
MLKLILNTQFMLDQKYHQRLQELKKTSTNSSINKKLANLEKILFLLGKNNNYQNPATMPSTNCILFEGKEIIKNMDLEDCVNNKFEEIAAALFLNNDLDNIRSNQSLLNLSQKIINDFCSYRGNIFENAIAINPVTEEKTSTNLFNTSFIRSFNTSFKYDFKEIQINNKSWNSLANASSELFAKVLFHFTEIYRRKFCHIKIDYNKKFETFAELFYYRLKGKTCTQSDKNLINAWFICLIEHGFSNSVDAGIRVASAHEITKRFKEEPLDALFASIMGESHGGAMVHIIKNLDKIAEVLTSTSNNLEHIKTSLDNILNNSKVIHGFGHRVYKELDGRVKVLLKYILEHPNSSSSPRLKAAKFLIEHVKKVPANVDLLNPVVGEILGIQDEALIPLFGSILVVSLYSYISKRVIEQNNRLLRDNHINDSKAIDNYIEKLFIEIENEIKNTIHISSEREKYEKSQKETVLMAKL